MTIYALSSGSGISGISIIRVSGPDTKNVIKKLTGKKPKGWYTGRTSPNTAALVVENGNFLSRLYERLKVDHLICPSLSERIPDILPILNYYISKFNSRSIDLSFSKSAISKLEMFNWPGNVAQLVNYVEKTVILNQTATNDLVLDVDNLALEMGDYSKDQTSTNNHDLSLKEARMEFEKEYLLSQIRRFSGNIIKVSEFTGMERTALYRKLKSLNISVK